MEEENQHQEKDHGEAKILLLRNIIDVWWVYSSPHNIYPSFSGHDIEQGDHRIYDIVKVRVSIDPLTTIIETFEFVLNMLVYICL